MQLLGVAMSGWDELGREQDMAAARAAAAIMANAVASFNEALVPVLRGVRREARALCKRLDPKWRRARIRALKRFRRNVETLKREGRCR